MWLFQSSAFLIHLFRFRIKSLLFEFTLKSSRPSYKYNQVYWSKPSHILTCNVELDSIIDFFKVTYISRVGESIKENLWYEVIIEMTKFAAIKATKITCRLLNMMNNSAITKSNGRTEHLTLCRSKDTIVCTSTVIITS